MGAQGLQALRKSEDPGKSMDNLRRRKGGAQTELYCCPMSPLAALEGTPYLLGDDPMATDRARTSLQKAIGLRNQAIAAQERLQREAHAALEAFEVAMRSDIVAESNQIEGNDWSLSEVREIVSRYRQELQSPTRRFLDAVRGDDHAYQVIGLYAAHHLAEQLAKADGPMREIDIRQLHAMVAGDVHFAGRYKRAENQIGGTTQRRTAPWDVPRAMHDLCHWWANSDADPLLQAAVVHAWLADIHPFDDGNGRVSRILANYSLVRAGYPPLILRSQSDRGEYYDALALSDDGNILPLLQLFVQALRRTVKIMKSPGYIQQVIDDRLLSSHRDRFALWNATMLRFRQELGDALTALQGQCSYQGSPTLEAFTLLEDHDPDGNCWFMKFGDGAHWGMLAWFGYESQIMRDLVSDSSFPSIHFSTRDLAAQAVHPYRPIGESEFFDLPNEVRLRPGSPEPLQLRWGHDLRSFPMREGSAMVAKSIGRALQLC